MFQRRLSLEEKAFWGTLLFAVTAIGYLLITTIENSTKEETGYLQSSYMNRSAKTAVMETSLGIVRITFLRSQAPVTVNNFVALAESGFYDNTKFHRVVKGLLVQGGDPLSRESDRELYGTGGPGYVFDDEIRGVPMVHGVVAMANLGRPKTNGSQFFIVVADTAPSLNGKYTVFGRVTEGMDIIDRINNVSVDAKDVPITPVQIDMISVE